NTVESRSTTGATSPARSNRILSLSTRVRAYSDTGLSGDCSVRAPPPLAPYTLQLEAKTSRRTRWKLHASIRILVAVELRLTVSPGSRLHAGSPTMAARAITPCPSRSARHTARLDQ